MSDENKCEEVKEHGCIIKCECLRKFLIVALGTFVGVYLALSLFAFVHKPPMPARMPIAQIQMPYQAHRIGANPFYHHKHFRHHPRKHHENNTNNN